MHQEDKISIIVPIYNMEQYLKKCVESIINQTYKNIEILLINDGSTDSSRIIIEEYAKKDGRIRSFHIDNGGVSRARNIGIENSIGEWIAFVDADDFIAPDTYEVLLKNALSYNVSISVCAHTFTKNTNENFTRKNFGTSCKELDYETSLYYLLGGKFEYNCGPCNKLFKKDVIGDIRFKENIANGEDLLFNFEIFSRKSIKTVFEQRVKYFILLRDGSACHDNSFKDRHLSEIDVWNFVYNTLLCKILAQNIIDIARYNYSMTVCRILLRLSYDYSERNKKIFYKIRNRYKKYICFNGHCSFKDNIKLLLVKFPYNITSSFYRCIRKICC